MAKRKVQPRRWYLRPRNWVMIGVGLVTLNTMVNLSNPDRGRAVPTQMVLPSVTPRPSATRTDTPPAPTATITETLQPTHTDGPTSTPTLLITHETEGWVIETYAAPQIRAARSDGDVRACASQECPVIGTLQPGEQVVMVESYGDGYRREYFLVQYSGGLGVVDGLLLTLPDSDYLPTREPDPTMIVATAPPSIPRPANCSTAVAMGLSAEQAAQWPHLDRDKDGVACYGS